MRKIIDLTNQMFGKIKVIKQVERNKHNQICWLCECSCDNHTQKIYSTNDLRMGKINSCGCEKVSRIIKYNKKTKKKYNIYDLTGEYGTGWTSNTNKEFYFDLEDYDKIKNYCWFENHKGYIVTNTSESKYLSIQRLVLNFPNCEDIDHNNRNRKDNRKFNLEPMTHQNNMLNQDIRSNNTSGVTGVTWDEEKGKWHSYIMADGKLKHLGFFIEINEAIFIRLKAEKKYNYSGANKELWKEYGII
jgi:hypothetical protein